MKDREERVLKRDQTMRVLTRLRRHNTSMPIGATLLSLTSTCSLTIHQHLGTMRISHMVEEHSKVKDLDRICNNIMPHNNNNSSKQDREQIIRGRGDLINLKTRCLLSLGKTKGC